MKFSEKHSAEEYQGFPNAFTEADLDQLIYGEIALAVTDVHMVETKYGSSYAVTFLDPRTNETREKLFTGGSIESRDRFLDDVAEFFLGDDRDPVWVVLQRWGRGIGLVLVEEPSTSPGAWGTRSPDRDTISGPPAADA